MLSIPNDRVFFDAGMFIGALNRSDLRFSEAFPLLEAGRRGDIRVCTSTGVLSEVFAALTWTGAISPRNPNEAAEAVARLIEAPSSIEVIGDSLEAALLHLRLAATHRLTARRIHDARHAATALSAGVTDVYTYDPQDWVVFVPNGITIAGPTTTMARLSPPTP